MKLLFECSFLSENNEEFDKIVAEMRLKESKDSPQIIGDDRNHHIKIYENMYSREVDVGSDGVKITEMKDYIGTNYDVEFSNPQPILMEIRKRIGWGFFREQSYPPWMDEAISTSSRPRYLQLMPYLLIIVGRDIRINDSEFDKQFSVKGNKENVVRAILDPSIRGKIMMIRDFNVIIGLLKRKDSSESGSNSNHVPKSLPSWVWKMIQPHVVFVPDVAQHVDYGSLSKIKQEPERFRAIIDTMIDIVEKIEKYTPPV